MSERNGDVEDNSAHADAKCKLSVLFESFGRKYAEETYPLELTVKEWIHVKKDQRLYSRLEKQCSESQAKFTDVTSTFAVIELTCDRTSCRSLGTRLQWRRSLEKYFNDITADLAILEHSLGKGDQSSVYKQVFESSFVLSGVASVFQSEDKIIVVTGKEHEKDVSHTLEVLIGKRRTLPSQSSGYRSLESASIETEVHFQTSVNLTDVESEFFKSSVQARSYIISQLSDHDIGAKFCVEDDKLKILLFAESKAQIDNAKDLYNSYVIKKTFTLGDSVIPTGCTREAIVGEWQKHFQKAMTGNAWCRNGELGNVHTVATKEVHGDVDEYVNSEMAKLKQVKPQRKRINSYPRPSSSSILEFTFQGKKLQLLKNRLQARHYVAQRTENTKVQFEADERSNVFRLVTTEEHRGKAMQLLSLIKTKVVEVKGGEGKTLQVLSEEVIGRHVTTKDKMMVETDTSINALVVTTTDDIFDKVLQTCEYVQHGNETTEKYEVSKEVMRVVLTEYKENLQSLTKNSGLKVVPKSTGDVNSFEISGCKEAIEKFKSFLDVTAKKIPRKDSTSRISSRRASQGETNGEILRLSKEIQNILAVSNEARKFFQRL